MSPADQGIPSSPDTQTAQESPAVRPATPTGPRRLIAGLLGAATVGLGSFGIWATVTASNLHTAAADANAAIVDKTATAAASRQITDAVQAIFSYSYADIARTKASAQRLLGGPAVHQYDQLFTLVERQAPKQKLSVTTRVTSLGVEFLAGGRARVLVFANQQDTRVGTNQASYGGAMFAVTAVDQHGTWQIVNIDTFTGGA